MKSVYLLFAAGLLVSLDLPSAQAQRIRARGVTQGEFKGWSDALVLQSRSAPAKAIVVPDVGGRVMSYGLHDQNVLWVNPDTEGWALASHPDGFQPGGFQCDLGPSVAGWPLHPSSWVGPYEWTAKRNYHIGLKAPRDEILHVEMEKEIQFDPATGDVGFTHRIKNVGELDSAYCLWHRIACQPGGFVLLPLNPKSRFPAGWSQRRVVNGRRTYDGEHPESAAIRLLDGVLVARTGGPETTVGVDSTAQWLAYAVGRTLFVIHFPTYTGSSAVYSEGGNTATATWTEQWTELQPFSPEARLRPRKTYDFPLKWSLIELPVPVTNADEARALVDKIPGSPFL